MGSSDAMTTKQKFQKKEEEERIAITTIICNNENEIK